MGVIMINNPGVNADVPSGSVVMWYGTDANIPSGWSRYTHTDDALVMGAASGQATTTKAGSSTHTHTTPSTSTRAAHTHTIGGGETGFCGSRDHYGTPNADSADADHNHTKGTTTSGSGGGHSHTVPNTGSASTFPPFRKLYFIQSSSGALPVGSIVLWKGVLSSIPAGWKICDGNNGTPNMSARFAYGAKVDGDVGVTGGASTHTHTNSSTEGAGSHTHSLDVPITGGGSSRNASTYGGVSLCAGMHDHSLSATSGTDANHTHTIGDTGSASTLPVYVNLFFIMRTI